MSGRIRTAIRRQRDAITVFAKRAGYELVGEFYDGASRGLTLLRPARALPRCPRQSPAMAPDNHRRDGEPLRPRLDGARGRVRQVRELGIELVTADSPNAFLDDGPTSKLIRQVLGAVAEFDKAMTVAKLRGARDRKRRELGKCEGRKSHAELRPEVVLEAKRLRRASPLNGKRRSFRKISRGELSNT